MSEEEPFSASGPGVPKRRGKSKKKHTVATVLMATLLALGLVTGLSVVFVYRHLNGNLDVSDVLNQVDNRPKEYGPSEAISILIMASDTRDGEGNKIDGESGAAGSDVTILLHIAADRSRAYGVSIPRDSLVDRPDCGPDNELPGGENEMWNKAFTVGQEACTVEQFEQATGIRVDDFVVLDFNGFKGMVDAVGGVPICLPYEINDSEHGITLDAGEREIMGEEALDYVRVRDVGSGSDIDRITRQQTFVASLVNKVVSAGTLARPDRVVRFLNAATKSLTVSPGLNDIPALGGLGVSLNGVGLNKVQFITVPFEYPQEPEFRGRVRWTPEADDLWSRIARDKPLSKSLSEKSIRADEAPGSKKKKPSPSASPTDPDAGEEEPTQAEIDAASAKALCA